MANLISCFSSCVLVLMLTLGWNTSSGHPVSSATLSAETCAHCSLLFKDLLLKISGLLNSTDLCYGIPSDAVLIRSEDTLLACAPTTTETSGCMMQRNSPFSESECLKNIMGDLAYYDLIIQSYVNNSYIRDRETEVTLLSPTQGIIKSLRKNCSLNGENGENDSPKVEVAKLWVDDSFTNRQEMCKMMKGFYTRTITINRAMGYISSGDHRK